MSELASGSVSQATTLVTIDGTQIIAEVGGSPLYRELKLGDHGPDVVTLHGLLAARGMEVAVESDTFDRQTLAAVRALRLSLGAPAGSTFGPEYVAYVPPTAVITSVRVSVGDVVTASAGIFDLAREVRSVTLRTADGSARLDQFEDAATSLVVGNDSLELKSVHLDDKDQAALSAFIRDRIADGSIVLDDSGKASGLSLALAAPIRVGTVPTTAVYSSPSGALCVFQVDAGTYLPVRIEDVIPSTEVGVAYVDRSLVGRNVQLRVSELDRKVLDLCG
ncbi:MAG: hypothetical protein ABIR17_11680 [Pseudolysinimonas sp.]|uniref:peptidoglycan-binding domain-containing protein n=1 Tax=Pseudolysinimonas sp. TaxID=2680009 RepID=UPI0032661829